MSVNKGNWNDLQLNSKGKSICPVCSGTRKKKQDKCVGVLRDKVSAKCYHCETMFFKNDGTFVSGSYKPSPLTSRMTIPTYYHNPKTLINTLKDYTKNTFVQYLKTLFTDVEVQSIIKEYRLGTFSMWGDSVVFWQIDNKNRIRFGQVMAYNPITGKRVKEPRNCITTIKTLLKLNLNGKSERKCLFGLHLINNGKPIAVVESEKTAAVMSRVKPEYNWLATGGKGNFNAYFLEVLKGNTVRVYPDKGCLNEWKNNAKEIKGVKFIFNEVLEGLDIENGSDIADLIKPNWRKHISTAVPVPTTSTKINEQKSVESTREKEEVSRLKVVKPPTLNDCNPSNNSVHDGVNGSNTPSLIALNIDLYNLAKDEVLQTVTESNWGSKVEGLKDFFNENPIPTKPIQLDDGAPANVPWAVIQKCIRDCVRFGYCEQTLDLIIRVFYLKLYINSKN